MERQGLVEEAKLVLLAAVEIDGHLSVLKIIDQGQRIVSTPIGYVATKDVNPLLQDRYVRIYRLAEYHLVPFVRMRAKVQKRLESGMARH